MDACQHPYYLYPAMKFNHGAIPFLFRTFPYDTEGHLSGFSNEDDVRSDNYMSRLERPYLPYANGGIGLYPPADCNGGYRQGAVAPAMANFWSVRMHVRPAVSTLPGTAMPGVYRDTDGRTVVTRDGGCMGDATLWGQFSYPEKGRARYVLPDPEAPLDSLGIGRLAYVDGDGMGDIQVGVHADTVYGYKE